MAPITETRQQHMCVTTEMRRDATEIRDYHWIGRLVGYTTASLYSI